MSVSSTNAVSTLPVSSTNSTLPISSTNSTLPVSSTAVSTQPATNMDAATKALKALSRSSLDNLWEDNVTNASFFGKIVGLVSYLWNRSTAIAQDKPEVIKAIEEYNKASAALVTAVVSRALTQQEALKNNISPVKFTNAAHQQWVANQELEANNKLTEFYAAFKTRITQLGVDQNSADYGAYASAAQKGILDHSKTSEVLDHVQLRNVFEVKMQTTTQAFNAKIFDDMVNSFTGQLTLADINIDRFKQKVASIKGFFENIDTVDIETSLRKAIKAKHDTAAFKAIDAEYKNEAVDAPRFVAARNAIQAKLTAEKTALETELALLRGPTGHDGTVHAAYQEKQAAETAMQQAYTALVVAFCTPANNMNAQDVTATLALITAFLGNPAGTSSSNVGNVDQIQQLLQDYLQKAEVFKAKNKEYGDLNTKLNEIAQYQGSDVPAGGKLALVNKALERANLDNAARAETAKVARFYTELQQTVGDNTKLVRSQALHKIID